jgi:hypothetical protein
MGLMAQQLDGLDGLMARQVRRLNRINGSTAQLHQTCFEAICVLVKYNLAEHGLMEI